MLKKDVSDLSSLASSPRKPDASLQLPQDRSEDEPESVRNIFEEFPSDAEGVFYCRLDEGGSIETGECFEPLDGHPQTDELRQRGLELQQNEIQRQYRQIDRRLEDFERLQLELQEQLIRQFEQREIAYRNQLADKDLICEDFANRLTAAAQRITELQNQVGIRTNEAQSLWEELGRWNAFERSRTWLFLRTLHAARLRLLPPGTRRERSVRFAYRAARRLTRISRSCAQAIRTRFMVRAAPVAGPVEPLLAKRPAPHFFKAPALADYLEPIEIRDLVSIVMPVYNHAYLVKEAIESVLAQTYRNFELIVVNDGSTDGVESVLAEYASHPQVRVLHQTNQKLPKALSNGFQFARGEFWTWTSADNLMHPEQLSKLVAYLRERPEKAMVYADYTAIDDRGELLKNSAFRPHNRYCLDDPAIHLPHSTDLLCVTLDNFIGPCFLYRAFAGRLLGEYDTSLGIEDYDYWMRMNMSFDIGHLDSYEPLYFYRVHDDSLSARATELGIYARAENLMDYQQRRSVFFGKPWTIYADEATLEFLKETKIAPHRMLPWEGRAVESDPYEKRMILVHSENLPAVAASNPPPEIVVGAWFDRNGSAPYRHRQEIRQLRVACFSREDADLERLALQTPHCFRINSPSSLLSQVVCFADNRAFMNATRTAEECARILPQPHFPKNQRMRVMLQVENFFQGGLEQVVLELAANLDRDHFDPVLLVLGEQGPAVQRARERGLRVLALPKAGREAAYRKLLIDERIDLVNAHFSIYGGYLASEYGIPFVQTVHTSYVWLSPEDREQYRENDPFTSAYVCVSQSAAQYSDLQFGLPVKKMIVVPNGANLARLDSQIRSDDRETTRARWKLNPQDYVFLNVSSIYAVKSQRELVEAFAKILPSCLNAKLLFLGKPFDENYYADLKRTVAELGLEKSVVFAGYHANVGPFYRAADTFVLPSFLEGWSLALTEAVCCDLPAIATDVGGAADLLAEVGGKIIPPPYGSAADLDRESFDRHSRASDPQFVDNLAAAMKSFYAERPRSKLTEETRNKFSSQNAYRNYERIFGWLAQGGYPEAIREWFSPANPRRNVDAERAL